MTTLIIIFIFVFLIGFLSTLALLVITILTQNEFELKRMAQLDNKDAKIVYPFSKMGYQYIVSLILWIIFLNSLVIVILSGIYNDIFAVLLSTALILMIGVVVPIALVREYGITATSKLAPVIKYLLIIVSPIAKPLGKFLDKRLYSGKPTIFNKEQLYKVFNDYKSSEHTDLSNDEIQIILHAISFGDKQVREIMTPRKVVVTVSADEPVGPVLIDDLHKSGYSRFPVFNDKKTQNFIGTLYLHDLVGLKVKSGEFVKDVMRRVVYYVHEEESLDYALKVFLKTNHHLLVVVNTFEEFVGVVSFEDVIEEIIGKQIMDEFDQHEDLRAVAKSLADKEKKTRESEQKKAEITKSHTSE